MRHAAGERELAAGLSAELREVLEPLLQEIESLNERIKEYDERMEKIAKESVPGSVLAQAGEGCGDTDRADLCPDDGRPASVRRRVARWAVFWGCDLAAGTPERANHRRTSAKKETGICER